MTICRHHEGMIHPDSNTEYFAQAQFKGPGNPPEDGYLAWSKQLIPPTNADSPGHVASHLRFHAQRTGHSLQQFIWEGQQFNAMGRKISPLR
jgi:hypothetical protein